MNCIRCKKEIFYCGRGRPPKYCKECYKEVKRYKDMMGKRRKRGLGESSLWEHRFKDFNREAEAIKNEKKRIGI